MKSGMTFLFVLVILTSANANVWTVDVANFQFTPSLLNILQGDTVDWINSGGFHNVRHICDPSQFANEPSEAPWTYRFIFNVPVGNYPYICDIHPSAMTGTIIVGQRGRWDVAVKNFSFSPNALTITQGDTVVWTNIQGFHNVHHTGSPSLFGNAIANAPWTYSFVFNLPASTYPYLCEQHPSLMTGTINVTAPEIPDAPAELTIQQQGSDVRLYWQPVCNAVEYTVYRTAADLATPFPDIVGVTADTTITDPVSGGGGTARFYYVKCQ